MKTIGNILWFLLTGIELAFGYFLTGLILCITIIGIPFGLQLFKLAKLALWPMGHDAKMDFGKHPIMNIIWALFFGWEMAITLLIAGLIWCVTIIGIPFGLQCFKLAKLSFIPFGANIQ